MLIISVTFYAFAQLIFFIINVVRLFLSLLTVDYVVDYDFCYCHTE